MLCLKTLLMKVIQCWQHILYKGLRLNQSKLRNFLPKFAQHDIYYDLHLLRLPQCNHIHTIKKCVHSNVLLPAICASQVHRQTMQIFRVIIIQHAIIIFSYCLGTIFRLETISTWSYMMLHNRICCIRCVVLPPWCAGLGVALTPQWWYQSQW